MRTENGFGSAVQTYNSTYGEQYVYEYQGQIKMYTKLRKKEFNQLAAVDFVISGMAITDEFLLDDWLRLFDNLEINLTYKDGKEWSRRDKHEFIRALKDKLNRLLQKLRKINGKKAPAYRLVLIDGHVKLTKGKDMVNGLAKHVRKRISDTGKLFIKKLDDCKEQDLPQELLNKIAGTRKQVSKMIKGLENDTNGISSLIPKLGKQRNLQEEKKKMVRRLKRAKKKEEITENRKEKVERLKKDIKDIETELGL